MRSHHAPTKKLLERFTHKDQRSRAGRALWVYERERRPRVSRDLAGECVRNGHFSGASSGEPEQAVDQRFALQYEVPFTRLLSAIDSDIHVFESKENREIAARFTAHMFQRSEAIRVGRAVQRDKLLAEYELISKDSYLLRAYCAKISVQLQHAVGTEDLALALRRNIDAQKTRVATQADYVDDIDRATLVLASKLSELHWTVLKTSTNDEFVISDTPVVSVGFDYFGQVRYGQGITNPRAEWFLPVSPNRVLRVSKRRTDERFVSALMMQELNNAQVLTCHKRLYSKEYSLLVDQLVQNCAGEYKMFEHVFKSTIPLSDCLHLQDF